MVVRQASRLPLVVNHGRDARATKVVATPPTGRANRVEDLSITDNGRWD